MHTSLKLLPTLALVAALTACTTQAPVTPGIGESSSSSSIAAATTSSVPTGASSAAMTSSSAESADTAADSPAFALTQNGVTVSGTLPQGWGNALPVTVTASGLVQGGHFDGNYVNSQTIDMDTRAVSIMLPGYQRGGTALGEANISLLLYPQLFTDDEEGAYQAMTAAEKQKILDPMIAIYNQRSLAGMDFTQLDAGMQGIPKYRGAWWGNGGYHSDRMAPRYVETKDGKLRGLAFFANEGQDFGFFPSYKVIMINPQNRVVLAAFLPLPDLAELHGYTPENWNTVDNKQIIAMQQRGYAYLNDPAKYAATPLGEYLKSVDMLIGALELR